MLRRPDRPGHRPGREATAPGVCNRGRSPVAHPATAEPGPDDAPIALPGLHPAGGSTAFFTGRQRAPGERARDVPVRLPGRDATGGHCRADLSSLVAALARDLGPPLDRPYLLYGHSMGALLAHRLTLCRTEQGRRLPERLLLGAYPAPRLPHPPHRAAGLSDAELVRLLVDSARCRNRSPAPVRTGGEVRPRQRLPGEPEHRARRAGPQLNPRAPGNAEGPRSTGALAGVRGGT
ncbi:thioesterase domain-containing protein [Kitasatospora aureofaciens]|uniref:thioesterase II family protein n=1 Tax=Kitasatospora aureofaciens TaxID=1894 RepID=UPI00123D7350|nr:hypothetical protein CP971_26355 [Streptomyces viridifaciens]